MSDEITNWLKTQLKNASMSGVTYYATRQKLIDKGYSKIDIDTAENDIRLSATPEDSSVIIWFSKYNNAARTESNKAFGNSILSKVPVVGPFFGIRSLKQSFDIASNTSGKSRKSIFVVWTIVVIAAGIIAYTLPSLISPVVSLLPSVLVLPILLFAQYGVPIILFVITWRYLFRKK